MNKRLRNCPVCNHVLNIAEYHCPQCDITIRGTFGVGDLASLSPAQQEFVKVFLCCGGNIKEVEKRLKISYPTVKNRLAEIQELLCDTEKDDRLESILAEIDSGKMTVSAALKVLKKGE